MNQESTIELKDFFRIIKSKIILILIISLLFTGVCCSVLFFIIPPSYEAEISVIVGKQAANGTNSTYDFSKIEVYQKLVTNYMEIAKSKKVAQDAAEKIDDGTSAGTIQNSITVTSKEDTQIISIKATSNSPIKAAEVANAVADSLISESKIIYNYNNLQVLDSAQVPWKPVKPQKKLDIIISFIVGIIISLIIVFLGEYMNKTFKSEKDVREYLKADIAAVIPDNKKIKNQEITALTDSDLPVSEAYRILKTSLKMYSCDNPPRVIAVTSAESGDGRTRTCVSLASALALEGSCVLLIDFDLRHPEIHKIFHVRNEHGLSDYVTECVKVNDIIVESGIENLALITSGGPSYKPWRILDCIDMEDIFKPLKGIYDYIIVDTPPINTFADTQVIVKHADACIMVVSCNKTIREEAVKAEAILEKIHADILGTVVYRNKVKASDFLRRVNSTKKAERWSK